MAFPAAAGAHLYDCFRLPDRTDHRIDRLRGRSTAGRISAGCFKNPWSARLLGHADHFLAGAWRWISQGGFHRRRRTWDRIVAGNTKRVLGTAAAGRVIPPVFVILYRRPGFPVVPVGFAAA